MVTVIRPIVFQMLRPIGILTILPLLLLMEVIVLYVRFNPLSFKIDIVFLAPIAGISDNTAGQLTP